MSLDNLRPLGITNLTLPELQELASRAAARPHLSAALGIDFYAPDHRDRDIEHCRWTVARFEWRGQSWHRVRKTCGPKTFDDACRELEFQCRRSGLPSIANS